MPRSTRFGTALHVRPLDYTTRRTGRFTLAGRTFELRRVAVPKEPTAEWFIVDLLRNAASVGLDTEGLLPARTDAVERHAAPHAALGRTDATGKARGMAGVAHRGADPEAVDAGAEAEEEGGGGRRGGLASACCPRR